MKRGSKKERKKEIRIKNIYRKKKRKEQIHNRKGKRLKEEKSPK